MLMVEVVAYSMLTIIALVAGGLMMHIILQRLVQLNMAKVARVESQHLDDELRQMNQRRNEY